MKRLLLTGAILAGAILTACVGPRTTYVVAGPPAPRYGSVGVAPGPGFVWIEGFWDLRGGAWVWAPGRWVMPPRERAVWVRPEWRREGNRWRYREGRWR